MLRLLHPMIPFHHRGGLAAAEHRRAARAASVNQPPPAESIMIAPWPEADPSLVNEEIEARFARFQEVLARPARSPRPAGNRAQN